MNSEFDTLFIGICYTVRFLYLIFSGWDSICGVLESFTPYGSKQKLLDIVEDIVLPSNDPIGHFVLHT